MVKRTIYREEDIVKPEKKLKYSFYLKLYEKDVERYDFQKILKFLAMSWECTMKEAILISLKDSYDNLN